MHVQVIARSDSTPQAGYAGGPYRQTWTDSRQNIHVPGFRISPDARDLVFLSTVDHGYWASAPGSAMGDIQITLGIPHGTFEQILSSRADYLNRQARLALGRIHDNRDERSSAADP